MAAEKKKKDEKTAKRISLGKECAEKGCGGSSDNSAGAAVVGCNNPAGAVSSASSNSAAASQFLDSVAT